MSKAKILAIAGSTRRESINSRLLAAAVNVAEEAGAQVTVVELADFPLPIMNQDLEREEGQPENAARLKQLFVESDGLLIASPEYNSSISPLLKNALDWVSRRTGDEPPAVAYRGKTVALLSAAPGRLGGIRGLVHLRSVFNALGSLVLADQGSVSSAYSAFDDDGNLVNEHDIEQIEGVARQLVNILTRLHTD